MSHELKEDALAASGAHSTLVEYPAARAVAAQIGPSLNPILISESPRGMGKRDESKCTVKIFRCAQV